MKSTRLFSLALVFAGLGASSWAAQPDPHAGHHPAGAASAAAAKAKAVKTNAEINRMDTQTSAMRLMHDRMAVAKTPEERAALMAEHMKTMQEGMAMMNGMSGGGMSGMSGMSGMKGDMKADMAMHHQTMEKRMEMMQAMMQMMMDRLPAASAK